MAAGDRSTWKGGGTKDFGNPLSWTNGVPANAGPNNPDCYFDGTSQDDCIQNVARGSDDFKLTVAPDHYGSIGTMSAPLSWTSANYESHSILGDGAVYINPSSAASRQSIITVDSKNLHNAVTILGATGFVHVRSGGVHINPECQPGRLTLHSTESLVTVHPYSGGSSNVWIIVEAGHLEWNRTLSASANMVLSGGSCDFNGNFASGAYVWAVGGRLVLAPDAAVSDGGLFAMAGSVDLSQSSFALSMDEVTIGPNCEFEDAADLISGTLFITDLRKRYP